MESAQQAQVAFYLTGNASYDMGWSTANTILAYHRNEYEGVYDFDGGPVLGEHGIDTTGIEIVEGGTTFAWEGRYGYDLNVAETLDTRLGVFEQFDPQLSPAHAAAPVLFLGNIVPDIQRRVRGQSQAGFVALDSMNLWIDTERDSLIAAMGEVDCVILNDGEARQLTGEATLTRAARAIASYGPRIVVIKRGEYGAALFTEGGFFGVPGDRKSTRLNSSH